MFMLFYVFFHVLCFVFYFILLFFIGFYCYSLFNVFFHFFGEPPGQMADGMKSTCLLELGTSPNSLTAVTCTKCSLTDLAALAFRRPPP